MSTTNESLQVHRGLRFNEISTGSVSRQTTIKSMLARIVASCVKMTNTSKLMSSRMNNTALIFFMIFGMISLIEGIKRTQYHEQVS